LRSAPETGAASQACISRVFSPLRRGSTTGGSKLDHHLVEFFLSVFLVLLPVSISTSIHAQQPANPRPATAEKTELHGSPVPSIPVISFGFERAGLPVPGYTIRIRGVIGSYEGTEIAEQPSNPSASPAPFAQSFTISEATAHKIVTLAHSVDNFNTVCASKAKNVADTGKKTLSYLGPDGLGPGQGACTYNYTENKNVSELTDIFRAMAETMDEGRRLDHLHRYDRLGLDAAIDFLAKELAAGYAIEPGTIAETLQSIANDTEVMQRVRTRAVALLALIPPDRH
jgi:hypothetical protein